MPWCLVVELPRSPWARLKLNRVELPTRKRELAVSTARSPKSFEKSVYSRRSDELRWPSAGVFALAGKAGEAAPAAAVEASSAAPQNACAKVMVVFLDDQKD